jgi:hypothetical protein
MKKKLVQYIFPAQAALLIGLLAGAVACVSETADNGGQGASSLRPASEAGAGNLSSTPVPVSAELVQEHAEAQRAINADWDSFHVDFDRWRSGISACDRVAAETSLRVFASDFGDITRQARNLPGKGIARELPDDVIAAATSEEASLRGLRDNWNPANTMPLESAQTTRAEAADLLRSTQVAIDRLEEMDDPDDRQIAKDFAGKLAPVESAWDEFYDSYGALEDEQLELDAGEIVSRLRDLVDQHEAVVEALEGIPSDKVTDPVQDPLLEAAKSEAEALGDLLDAMRRAARSEAASADGNGKETASADGNGKETASADGNGEETASADGNDDKGEEATDESEATEANGGNGEMSGAEETESNGKGESGDGAPQDSAEDARPDGFSLDDNAGPASPTTQGGISDAIRTPFPRATPEPPGQPGSSQTSDDSAANGGEAPDYTEHFDAFEEALDSSRAVRRTASRDLEDLVEGFSENDREALAEFVAAFGELMEPWDDFHKGFDGWVRTEGDCDRAGESYALQLFNQRFSELDHRVRALSQVSYLRPSSDLLSEAVGREGAALHSLANTWVPYENDVYRDMDEERANADKLRRLSDRRVQELMERNGISLGQ